MPSLIFGPGVNSLSVRWSNEVTETHASFRRPRNVHRYEDDPLVGAISRHLYESLFSCPDMQGPLQLLLIHSDSRDQYTQVLDATPESIAFFGVLSTGSKYGVLVFAASEADGTHFQNESAREGDFVAIRQGLLGRVVSQSSGLFTDQMSVEVMGMESSQTVKVHSRDARVVSRRALLAINFTTLPGFSGLPEDVCSSIIFSMDTLGSWLLRLPDNYAYAAGLSANFVVALFEHGLFVLPGDQELFSCPFPLTPYVFHLQENPPSSWRGKMVKRYGREFEMSCNVDFQTHLRLCAQYHTEKGGTWINEELIELLTHIHRDTSNRIRMYCFELWDKASGQLAAASFGLRIGAFFHDFSMSCLMKDRRSAGSILTKAVGALLTDCGVRDWYWGCKIGYMAEYEAYGAKEIPRKEYYESWVGSRDR